jgi:ribosomal protein L11 methyltransferase
MLMAALRINIPVVFVSGGPMEAGKVILRGKEKAAGKASTPGNQVSAMSVPVRSNIADPLARLAAIRDYTVEAKEAKAGVSARIMTDLSQHIPGATMAAVARILTSERFAVRGTHLETPTAAGRIAITLDAGVAFGSGEHGSTRGCLRALEMVAYRRPTRILDLGTGSGILAMAATRLLHRPSLATDIDPWSVRTARDNARLNHLAPMMRFLRADGWTSPVLTRNAPYDLIFANILARPLTKMAKHLSAALVPGGTAILAGLLVSQVRWVAGAHRLHVERVLTEGQWATLILRKPAKRSGPAPSLPSA